MVNGLGKSLPCQCVSHCFNWLYLSLFLKKHYQYSSCVLYLYCQLSKGTKHMSHSFSQIKDSAAIQALISTSGTNVEIWYATNLHWDKQHPYANIHQYLSEHYTMLGSLNTKATLEEVYCVMQGENWSPMGEARDLIRSKGLSHTSLSIGDVVRIGQRYYECAAVGFKLLPARRL